MDTTAFIPPTTSDAAPPPPPPTCRPQALASQALTHTVAHHLRAAGFTSASERALHTLTSAVEMYIGEMGRRSVERAHVCARRVAAWDDVLGVFRDFSGVGEVTDVRRMVEREMNTGKQGTRQAGGVGAILGARARRWRETRGKIRLDMSEEAAEEWLDDEEDRRRAALRKRSGGMLGRMDVPSRREDRAERGHVKGLAPLRAHVQDGLESREEKAARPVLHSIPLPPPDRYHLVTRTPSPEVKEDETVKTPIQESPVSGSLAETDVHVKMERSPSPRGVKRRRSSMDSAGTRDRSSGGLCLPDRPIFDEPYLPPLPGKIKHEPRDAIHYPDEEEDEPMEMHREENGTSAAIDSARRTALEIYTSGAIPYEQSTLAIAYDVSHLTAMKWRKPRGQPPALLPSAVSSLVKAHKASVEAASKPPPSKSSRSFKIAAADALSATVGHPLLYALAGTTHQVPGLASGSGSATPRGNPFVPSYPIWAKTELPVNEAHERDKTEKEVYPVKSLPRESAPLGPTVALNLMPSPAMFNPRQPELLRTLITEMAGHPFVDQPSRSGWLRPSALRQFTELQPPEAIKVDAATAAESGGELHAGMPYLYGDAVRAPGQLGSMDAKIRAAKAKDRKLKAAQQAADGTARKLKISFAGASVARNEAEALAEQLEAEEALLRDQDEIMLRATWPVMSEERGDWQTLMEPPPPPPPPMTTTTEEQPSKRMIASGIGKRLSDILPPPPPDAAASMKRKLVFRRPGEVTPVSESPPTPAVPLLGRDSSVGGHGDGEPREVTESRPGLKFKLKLPMAT